MFHKDICKHSNLTQDIKSTMRVGTKKEDSLRGYVSSWFTNFRITLDKLFYKKWFLTHPSYYSGRNLEIEEKQIGLAPFIAC